MCDFLFRDLGGRQWEGEKQIVEGGLRWRKGPNRPSGAPNPSALWIAIQEAWDLPQKNALEGFSQGVGWRGSG